MAGSGLIATAEGSRAEAFGVLEWGLLAGIALIWGSSFVFIAKGLEAFTPGVVAWARLTLGFLTLAMFPAARAPVARVDWGRIAILSVFWMAVPFVLIPTAQQWITSALAGMINGAMPLFSALVAAVLLRRFPGKPQVAGLAVGFTGVVLITIPGGEDGGSVLGVLLVLAATVFYGFSLNVAVPLQQRYGSLPVLLRSLGGAALLTLPLGLVGIADSRWDMLSGLSVLSLGIVGTGIAFVLMATLVGRAGAIRGGVAIYFVPMVAVVLGVVVRDESVAAWALLGILLVLGGAYLTSRREVHGEVEAAPR